MDTAGQLAFDQQRSPPAAGPGPNESPRALLQAASAIEDATHGNKRTTMDKRMKSLTEHLWFEVPNRRGFVNITGTVEELVRKSGVQEGLCLVNAMHITASVFINDAEDGLLHDYEVWLERLAPHEPV